MKVNKSIAILLVIILMIQIPALSASAISLTEKTYEYEIDETSFTIQYTLLNEVVTEITTISDNKETYVIQKAIHPDGTIYVYLDGIFLYSASTDKYQNYLACLTNNINTIAPYMQTYSTSICGQAGVHLYVTTTYETIDIAASNLTQSVILSILLAALNVPTGASIVISALHGVAKYAFDSGVDYIDIAENKYFVDNAELGMAMNCFHSRFVYYNITSSGEKDIHKTEWKYYQYML